MPSCFVGLVLENCQLPLANHGHVILADPSPILFYPISSTEIRCLVDVPGQKLPSVADGEMANYLKTVVAPQVCILCDHDLSISSLLFRIDRESFCCRFHLSFMAPSYLQLRKEILELCQIEACRRTRILLREPS